MNNKLRDFFYDNPVFRYEDIRAAYAFYKEHPYALWRALNYHKNKGHIVSIRKHVYATVPRGASAEEALMLIDPILIASKLTEDAVVAYHSALDFYGWLHSVRYEIVYLSGISTQKSSAPSFEYGGCAYRCTILPGALKKKGQALFEVNQAVRCDQKISVTSAERTFVDVLDRPGLLRYDWEEIARSLEKVYLEKPSVIIKYLELLGSGVTASRVGYFLERNQKAYGTAQEVIDEIHKLRSKCIVYLDRNHKKDNILSKKWNLMVPRKVFNSIWEETRMWGGIE